MLQLIHKLSKPSSMAMLAHRPDRVFPFLSTTNNWEKQSSSLAIQDYTSLADSYYVLSYSLSPLDYPPEDFLRNTSVIPFSNAYYLLFFWCCHILWCTHAFLHFCKSFSVIASTLFSSLALWMINMDDTISLKGPWGSGSLNSSHLKYLNGVIK